ncbi:hypothetical protein QYE76_058627 [Lolium multiflorum]|uniref:F-box domain-containing protein n=1 Tax=Lolium multiflorum TaxID=4521 RepID=A0AAD8T5V1_LOLMU|nr:hypothetical protein QYE76_058627 [Lolium multiflorum]
MEAPYDVVREILVRVKDKTTLFRCATTCKGWCSLLVADTSFLRRCLPQDDAPFPFSGFIAQRHWYAPCFVPVPHPVLAPRPVLYNGCRFLDSFFPGVPAGYFDNAVPLTSRRGLLLVRLEPHHVADDPDPSSVLMAVCNPLAATVQELPRLEHYWDFQEGNEVTGFALLTDADCSSSSNDTRGVQRPPGFFKVLIISIDHSQRRYNLHTFSSAGESGWNTCSGVHGISAMLRQRDAVVLRGAAHWLLSGATGTYTLQVIAETGHVSSAKMMGVTIYSFCRKYNGKPYLTVNGEGNLTVLRLRKDGRWLEIWTSHDSGRSFQASKLVLQRPDQRKNGYTHVCTCLGEKGGMMLVKVKNRHVYMVDIKTGVMREVPDWPSSNALNRRKIVPIEIDWTAFFASRLAYVLP